MLRARGARSIALGSWFLAPGRLLDRVIEQARALEQDVRVAEPLGPAIADVVLDRYADTLVTENLSQYA
jgi:sirohydrochlorin ferrochelatase